MKILEKKEKKNKDNDDDKNLEKIFVIQLYYILCINHFRSDLKKKIN